MASLSRSIRAFSASARAGQAIRASAARASVGPAQQTFRRGYSSGNSEGAKAASGSSGGLFAVLAAAAAAGGGYYYYTAQKGAGKAGAKSFKPAFEDYQKVYNEIAQALEDNDEYDDGSYGPVLLRLAWHCSGTYDKETGTGGSNGATMRFSPESLHGANAGLKVARDFLEPIKAKFPWISYGDLWTLAGVCAVQQMQGPAIPWRPGRSDMDASAVTPDGRLPDAAQGAKHVRDIFYRMGFDDQEIVALIGAHALGRGHKDRSGYDGPWTFSPTVLTNDFYTLLRDEKWTEKKWDGPKQFEDKGSKSLMMMPADMAFLFDKNFKQHVDRYAADNDAFFTDFSAALIRLFELGVPFQSSEKDRFTFKTKE